MNRTLKKQKKSFISFSMPLWVYSSLKVLRGVTAQIK